MSKIALVVGLVFLLSFQSDDEAGKEILKNVQKIYAEKCITQSLTYTITILESEEERVSTGTFKTYGDKYSLDLGTQKLVSNGKVLFQLIIENNQSELTIECESSEKESIINVINSSWVYLENDDNVYRFRRNSEGNVYDMWVDGSNFTVSKIKISQKNSTKFEYRFGETSIENSCSNDEFEVILDEFEDIVDIRDSDC